MSIYHLKITNRDDTTNWKLLAVSGEMTLYKFAEKIVESFGFDFDHAFCFTSNLTNPFGNAEKLFELFKDIPEVEATDGAKSVKRNKVKDAFSKKGEKLLFLFDYGDSWVFLLQCKEIVISEKEVRKNYLKILEVHGDYPEQYPEYQDEM